MQNGMNFDIYKTNIRVSLGIKIVSVSFAKT